MGLYERWTASDETKLRVHAFATALRELARGVVTRQQIIDGFGLAGVDVTELDSIISQYNGLANQAAKDRYVVLLHDVMILSEDTQTRPLYTRAFALARLGF